MQRLLLVAALCLVSCLASDVKNATAKGSYGVQNDYNQSPPSYGQTYQQPSYDSYVSYQYIRPPLPPLVDRDVCDLDASVLLVVHSKRHGHHSHHHDHHLNRAHRVRCSVIANYDEDSCNVCCQHAARRDKKLQNSQFVGFLAVTDDFEGNHHNGGHHHRDHDEEEENLRVKRGCDGGRDCDSHNSHYSNKVEPIRVAESDYKPKPYFKNVKCVCCAPKRPLPPPPVMPPPVYQPPVYPSNEQPSYQQPAQPTYQPAPQTPPTYVPPQAPPAPAPYVAPVPAPAPAQPTYQAPVAQNPQPY
ncbi:hypothetical protein ANCCAN_01451 [Ancylostoma caninum]|uniref:Uncharacterized protein n=1 Tax=Ancylostoma caninum TaxID=29170 RepID=A0A368H9L8_ANCCA|nr:hypothetical protein ANCCAN_01451 [Ancylostoma caninum]